MVTWISLKAIAGSYLNIDRDKRILSSRTTQMADFWLRELYVKIYNGSPRSTLILNIVIAKYEAIIKNYSTFGYSNERTALLPESKILNNI